jgi:hypothetical protein
MAGFAGGGASWHYRHALAGISLSSSGGEPGRGVRTLADAWIPSGSERGASSPQPSPPEEEREFQGSHGGSVKRRTAGGMWLDQATAPGCPPACRLPGWIVGAMVFPHTRADLLGEGCFREREEGTRCCGEGIQLHPTWRGRILAPPPSAARYFPLPACGERVRERGSYVGGPMV